MTTVLVRQTMHRRTQKAKRERWRTRSRCARIWLAWQRSVQCPSRLSVEERQQAMEGRGLIESVLHTVQVQMEMHFYNLLSSPIYVRMPLVLLQV